MSAINYLPRISSYTGAAFTNLGVRNLYNYFTTADLSQKSGLLKNGALKLAVAVAAYAISAGNSKLAGTGLIIQNLQMLAITTAALTVLSIPLKCYAALKLPEKTARRAVYKDCFIKVAVVYAILIGLQLHDPSKAPGLAAWTNGLELSADLVGAGTLIWGVQQIFSGFRAIDVNEQNSRLKNGIFTVGLGGVSLAGAIAIRVAK